MWLRSGHLPRPAFTLLAHLHSPSPSLRFIYLDFEEQHILRLLKTPRTFPLRNFPVMKVREFSELSTWVPLEVPSLGYQHRAKLGSAIVRHSWAAGPIPTCPTVLPQPLRTGTVCPTDPWLLWTPRALPCRPVPKVQDSYQSEHEKDCAEHKDTEPLCLQGLPGGLSSLASY